MLGNSRIFGQGQSPYIGSGAPAVRNAGALVLLYAEVRGLGASTAIETDPDAVTAVGASHALNSTFFEGSGGRPQSAQARKSSSLASSSS